MVSNRDGRVTGKNLLSKRRSRGVDSGPPASQVTSVLSYLVAGQKLVVKAHSFHTGHKGWLLRGGPPPISEYLQNEISTIAPQYFDLGFILFNLVDK